MVCENTYHHTQDDYWSIPYEVHHSAMGSLIFFSSKIALLNFDTCFIKLSDCLTNSLHYWSLGLSLTFLPKGMIMIYATVCKSAKL